MYTSTKRAQCLLCIYHLAYAPHCARANAANQHARPQAMLAGQACGAARCCLCVNYPKMTASGLSCLPLASAMRRVHMTGKAHLERPLLSMMTSARSMLCVLAAKASFRFCHVHPQGRLCTTTCNPSTAHQGLCSSLRRHPCKSDRLSSMSERTRARLCTCSWSNCAL